MVNLKFIHAAIHLKTVATQGLAFFLPIYRDRSKLMYISTAKTNDGNDCNQKLKEHLSYY